MACILLWSSAVRVHDSQDGKWMWQGSASVVSWNLQKCFDLSFKTGFNLVNAVVICATLESISGLKPSSDTTGPRYLKLVTVSSSCPFTMISMLMPLVLFASTRSSWHWSPCRKLWRLCRDAQLLLPVLLPPLQSHWCHKIDCAFVIF